MKSAILNYLSEMRASYWYTPLMMLVMAILLATLTIYLDERRILEQFGKFSWLMGGNPDGARSFLSTVATAMITVASITFSMTLLAVTFAGSQIGPRLTGNFMRDKTNQLTLGFFIATFLYCLLILRSIVFHNNSNAMVLANDSVLYVPQISLLLALIMAIMGLIILVYFIHHIPNSINMSNVISSVGKMLFNRVDSRFPLEVGQNANHDEVNISQSYHNYTLTVPAHTFGYIRILDAVELLSLAQEHDCVFQLESTVGDFITPSSPLLLIYSRKPISDALIKQCQTTYAVGHKRNQEQDLDFLVNELIEIIARALSPGLNDPYTAINAFDWLHLFLQKLYSNEQPSRGRKDAEGMVRLLTPLKDLVYYAQIIFTQTRLYVSKDYNATVHVLKVLQQLRTHTGKEYETLFDAHAEALIGDANIALQHFSCLSDLPAKYV